VGFLIEVFWAVLMVGLPIGVFTLLLVWWSLHGGHFQESSDSRALQREIKTLFKNNKKKGKEAGNIQHPLQKKWAKFGGGFYGIVAFFTYIVIEVTEITTMIVNFGGFFDFLRQLNFNLIINILVEAITNFVAAMVWPVYWMKRIDTDHVWIWFMVAYGGYWLGLRLAQALNQRLNLDRSNS
jgi:hypothetical protein